MTTDNQELAAFVADYLSDAEEGFEAVDRTLLALEKEPGQSELMDEIFRAMHNLKSSSAMMRFEQVAELAHETESMLSVLRQKKLAPPPSLIDLLFEINDTLAAMVRAEAAGKPSDLDAQKMINKVKSFAKMGMAGAAQSGAAETRARPLPALEKSRTVRVNKELLDSLFNSVGELMISQNRIHNLAAQDGGKELQTAVAAMGRIVEELRDGISTARMVPAEEIFEKFPRMMHDLARDAGKEVDFVVEGSGVELDKGMLDTLVEPLIHLLRNAVDHGIETPAVRLAAGKNETGAIRLAASRAEEGILIEVEDDGAGIDVEQVKKVAVSKGVITAEEAANLTGTAAFDVLFQPGFSSQREASSVSGRGVGLDVVQKAVKELGGVVEVNSAAGAGSRFSLKLPLSTAIIQALIVEVGGSLYALSANQVMQTFEIKVDEIKEIPGRQVLIWQGEVLPFSKLGGLLDREHRDKHKLTGILLQPGGQKKVIGVDRVVDQIECIIKPLDPLSQTLEGISGGTILGDGRIVLLLDVAALLNIDAFKGR